MQRNDGQEQERIVADTRARKASADNTGTLFSNVLGSTIQSQGRECIVSREHDVGHLLYGATDRREPGRYRVAFEIAMSGSPRETDPICAMLDVVANSGKTSFGERFIKSSELGATLRTLSLDVVVREARSLEYRVFATGKVGLVVDGCPTITKLSDIVDATPSVRDSQIRKWENEAEFLDGYLRNISGIVHVGANIGQEREYYRLFGLDVVWVEPIKEVFDKLVDNISGFSRQRAFLALLADQAGVEYEFNIANNGGASSSILPFDAHAELWPDVKYQERRTIRSSTLDALMSAHDLTTDSYQALTMDVEGAELLVLRGAASSLPGFQYIKAEVADFTPRTGSPLTSELDAFLEKAGFTQLIKRPFASGPGGVGTYWDIVWKRVPLDGPVHPYGFGLPIVASADDVSGMDKVPPEREK